jgi:hypothetical protein
MSDKAELVDRLVKCGYSRFKAQQMSTWDDAKLLEALEGNSDRWRNEGNKIADFRIFTSQEIGRVSARIKGGKAKG